MRQPRRTARSSTIFGIQIVDTEKFIATLLGAILTVLGIVITSTFYISKFYLQQDFNEKMHQQERSFDNMQRDLKTELKDCEDNKNLVTKEDLEHFKLNMERSKKSEK